MENNNRTILAIALIVLLWSGYSLFFAPQQQPVQSNQVDPVVEEKVAPVNVQPSLPAQVQIPVSIPDGYEEKIVTVSSDLYEIKISTTGATVRSVVLNKYKQSNSKDSDPYVYKDFSGDNLATFKTSGSEGLAIPVDLPFEYTGQSDSLNINEEIEKITFVAKSVNGLDVYKTYTFHKSTYQVDVNVFLQNTSSNTITGLLNFSLINPKLDEGEDKNSMDMYTHLGPISFNGEELIEDNVDDLKESAKIYGSSIVWSGFVAKYFLTIVSPQESAKQVQIQSADGYYENRFISPLVTLNPGENKSFDYVAFIGPKDYDLLKSTGYQFEQAKDYGFFSVLAKPLMHVLKFFYGFIGNYGFAIILLTVCIKLLFWPLTQKSYKSMKGMQKLQPQMQKLREKYADDKQRLNQEMMTFYKENKVNPLGGCLPMLIQIPVFFALYQVLLGAIELRHAPFILWITDLSVKDPYYVTPLIMGVTMFLQQKMTPTNMDPTQEKIMLMMPVVFTFLFLNFPAGLVVYWMVNNILTILQQYLIRRQPD